MDSDDLILFLAIAAGISFIVRVIGVADNSIVIAISVVGAILAVILYNQTQKQKYYNEIKDYKISKLQEELQAITTPTSSKTETPTINIKTKEVKTIVPPTQQINNMLATFMEVSFPIVEEYFDRNEELIYEYYRGAVKYITERNNINEQEVLVMFYSTYFQKSSHDSINLANNMLLRTHNPLSLVNGIADMELWINEGKVPQAEMLLNQINIL